MAEYFAVFNEQQAGESLAPGTKYEKAETLDLPKTARVINIKAESIAEAQKAVQKLFGSSTSTPVVVAAAQWKTS